MPGFYQGALIAIAFRKTVSLREYVQNLQRLDIAAGVDKITDSKHKTQRYDKLVAYL
ncbi:MAG: hypothetical protein RMY64_24605 [Nostoc sp. DedQUE08]|uniref:hypothetical protein n=1 Tax=Nostoc sp. DedQUE08 TaxID=3075393 RepID=UPI002AD48CD5|nr:hypothetical protein [Nostoc sp. DedQUE08]MDZ8068777.1 hypothetical protein [Nostoc sp. DedQUE08]